MSMISAVAQTLGKILADETSVGSLEAISFNFPQTDLDNCPELILYFYKVQPISQELEKTELLESFKFHNSKSSETLWFDIFFLLSTEDRTTLGRQRLLSEALGVLLRHDWVDEQLLAPVLRGYGSLPLVVHQPQDLVAFWQVLGVPFRPALYLSVTAPLRLSSSRATLVGFPDLRKRSDPASPSGVYTA